MKPCNRCQRALPLGLFSKNRRAKDGLCTVCKDCYRDYWKSRPKPPEKRRRDDLRRLYGIRVDDYDQMFQAQGGLCAICHSAQPDKPLGVDHDHATGAVRQLLCDHCNRGLGLFRDDSSLLAVGAIYLTQHDPAAMSAIAEPSARPSALVQAFMRRARPDA